MRNATDALVPPDPATQSRFVDPLSLPPVIDLAETPDITLQLRQARQLRGLWDEGGNPLATIILGCGLLAGPTSMPGPTLLAGSGQPMQVL